MTTANTATTKPFPFSVVKRTAGGMTHANPWKCAPSGTVTLSRHRSWGAAERALRKARREHLPGIQIWIED